MIFDESSKIKGVPRSLIRKADQVLEEAKSLQEVISLWLTSYEREVILCNGVDDDHNFDSLCIVLKDFQTHAAERYIKLTTLAAMYPDLKSAASFVHWEQYYASQRSPHDEGIARHLDQKKFNRFLGVNPESLTDDILMVPVLPESIAMRSALAHAISPCCDAAFTLLNPSFYEDDEEAIEKWGTRRLTWLFTNLRTPTAIGGIYPASCEGVVVDFTAKTSRTKQKRGPIRPQNLARSGLNSVH